MRHRPLSLAVLVAIAAATTAPIASATDAAPAIASAATAPATTSRGTRFTPPAGWTLSREGDAVRLVPPEGEGLVLLSDGDAADADAAVAAAWTASGRPAPRLKLASDLPGEQGWDAVRSYNYDPGVGVARAAMVRAMRHDGRWMALLVDVPEGLMEKRLGEVIAIFDRLEPAGYTRETFAGRTPAKLDAARVKALGGFIARAQDALKIPGVSWGLVQDGRVVHVGGEGVREARRPERADADTLYIVASNTKAMTTLMLGRLIEQGRFVWDTPVASLMPGFALGDAATTARVQVQHLVCACTGLPRQDLEWIMEFRGADAASTLRSLATMQPTSDFGALYQYSNPLASAGGYVGAHVLFPDLELGAAYDRAMQEQVFGPLGMKDTTFDFDRAMARNHASPHQPDLSGVIRVLPMDFNRAVIPVRPAGGAWSSARDMLRYVAMELARGRLPDGSRYASEAMLAERLRTKVMVGNDARYGMGLETDTTWGIPVVHHGGSMLGYKSDMIWLPEHGVGAVVLTNSDTGRALLDPFRRRLLEVLFDGEARAAEDVEAAGLRVARQFEAERKDIRLPGEPGVLSGLAPRYSNPALGALDVRRDGERTVFDFGEWNLDVGTHRDAAGGVEVRSVSPGLVGFNFIVGQDGGTRTLTLRDPQREYVFREVR